MFNQLAIEAAQWEREREIHEAIRRRRLLSGDGSDPDVDRAAVSARWERRQRRIHPVRLVTP